MLGSRKWSLYARLYARHFNELDHEFNARSVDMYPVIVYSCVGMFLYCHFA